jgi:RNA polymerase sigma factor (sigma-70 family)
MTRTAEAAAFSLVALSDEALARLAGDGDRDAFAELYERHSPGLYRYCLGILRDPEDAQDAMQATMTRALTALERHEAPSSCRAWLFSIAHNEAVDHVRRRRRYGQLREVDHVPASSVEGKVEQRAELASVLEDLGRLSDRQRSALLLRELRGLNDHEIGAELEIPPTGVRQAVFEARTALKDLATGRELACPSVLELIAGGDRRRLRSRPVRAHIGSCGDCRTANGGVTPRVLWPVPLWVNELAARLTPHAGQESLALKAVVVAVAGATLATGVAVDRGGVLEPRVAGAPSSSAPAHRTVAALTGRSRAARSHERPAPGQAATKRRRAPARDHGPAPAQAPSVPAGISAPTPSHAAPAEERPAQAIAGRAAPEPPEPRNGSGPPEHAASQGGGRPRQAASQGGGPPEHAASQDGGPPPHAGQPQGGGPPAGAGRPEHAGPPGEKPQGGGRPPDAGPPQQQGSEAPRGGGPPPSAQQGSGEPQGGGRPKDAGTPNDPGPQQGQGKPNDGGPPHGGGRPGNGAKVLSR